MVPEMGGEGGVDVERGIPLAVSALSGDSQSHLLAVPSSSLPQTQTQEGSVIRSEPGEVLFTAGDGGGNGPGIATTASPQLQPANNLQSTQPSVVGSATGPLGTGTGTGGAPSPTKRKRRARKIEEHKDPRESLYPPFSGHNTQHNTTQHPRPVLLINAPYQQILSMHSINARYPPTQPTYLTPLTTHPLNHFQATTTVTCKWNQRKWRAHAVQGLLVRRKIPVGGRQTPVPIALVTHPLMTCPLIPYPLS